jgi:hypothetical protein
MKPPPEKLTFLYPSDGFGEIVLNWSERPTTLSVLGNATGRQYIAFIDSDGRLWSSSSEGLRFNDTNRTMLRDIGPGDWTLRLGYLRNGTVGIQVTLEGLRYQWMLTEWPNGWTPSEQDLDLSVPPIITNETRDLPYRGQIQDFRETGCAASINGTVVVVGAFVSAHTDDPKPLYPCVVFQKDDHHWSNIVRLWHEFRLPVTTNAKVAGTALNDMIIVTCQDRGQPEWHVYYFKDASLVDAGTRDLSAE